MPACKTHPSWTGFTQNSTTIFLWWEMLGLYSHTNYLHPLHVHVFSNRCACLGMNVLNTCRRTSWSSRMFDLVEYSTFLITSLASCRHSLLRAGLNRLTSVTTRGDPGSLLSVDDIETTDWLTFGDSEVLSVLLNLTVKATNHLRTDSLALIILWSGSLPKVLLLLRGTCATKR